MYGRQVAVQQIHRSLLPLAGLFLDDMAWLFCTFSAFLPFLQFLDFFSIFPISHTIQYLLLESSLIFNFVIMCQFCDALFFSSFFFLFFFSALYSLLHSSILFSFLSSTFYCLFSSFPPLFFPFSVSPFLLPLSFHASNTKHNPQINTSLQQ